MICAILLAHDQEVGVILKVGFIILPVAYRTCLLYSNCSSCHSQSQLGVRSLLILEYTTSMKTWITARILIHLEILIREFWAIVYTFYMWEIDFSLQPYCCCVDYWAVNVSCTLTAGSIKQASNVESCLRPLSTFCPFCSYRLGFYTTHLCYMNTSI